MATRIIWVNPADSTDTIEFNDDSANGQFYRFRIDTGFDLTLLRDSLAAKVILNVSGGGYGGVLSLNKSGEIWSNDDLTIRLDKDGGGANNKLIVRNSSSTPVFTVDEAGVASVPGKYLFDAPQTRDRVFGPFVFGNVQKDSVVSSDLILQYASSSGGTKPYSYLRAKDLVQSACYGMVPVDFPNGAVLTKFSVAYRKISQAGGKFRNMQCDLMRSPAFALSGPHVNIGTIVVQNTDGSAEFASKTYTILAGPNQYEIVDNVNYSYGILIDIQNTDSGNSGADGIGFVESRITFTVAGPGDD